jgi:hypothetical protein
VEAIEKEFHSFEAMRNELSAAAVAIKVVFAFLFLILRPLSSINPLFFHHLPILMIYFTLLIE